MVEGLSFVASILELSFTSLFAIPRVGRRVYMPATPGLFTPPLGHWPTPCPCAETHTNRGTLTCTCPSLSRTASRGRGGGGVGNWEKSTLPVNENAAR